MQKGIYYILGMKKVKQKMGRKYFLVVIENEKYLRLREKFGKLGMTFSTRTKQKPSLETFSKQNKIKNPNIKKSTVFFVICYNKQFDPKLKNNFKICYFLFLFRDIIFYQYVLLQWGPSIHSWNRFHIRYHVHLVFSPFPANFNFSLEHGFVHIFFYSFFARHH